MSLARKEARNLFEFGLFCFGLVCLFGLTGRETQKSGTSRGEWSGSCAKCTCKGSEESILRCVCFVLGQFGLTGDEIQTTCTEKRVGRARRGHARL